MPPSPVPIIPNLAGKVALVTGGSAGIGLATTRHLLQHGATVYFTARSESKAQSATTAILSGDSSSTQLPEEAKSRLHHLILDLTSLSSVVTAAKTFKSLSTRLDILILTAGIMATPYAVTADGFEAQWQTNYLSHWLLTYHLLPLIRHTASLPENMAAGPGAVRVVCVSSGGHEKFAPKSKGIDFEDINQEHGTVWSRYGMSKLGNVLHARYLNHIYGPKGTELHTSSQDGIQTGPIYTTSIHPGNVATDLNRNSSLGQMRGAEFMEKVFSCLGVYMPVEEAGRGVAFAGAGVVNGKPYFESGGYLDRGKVSRSSKFGEDEKLAGRLWEWSEKELRGRGLLDL